MLVISFTNINRVHMRMTLALTLVLGIFAVDAQASVRSYFNHRSDRSYLDPIHNVQRPGDNLEAVILAEMGKATKSIWVAVQELRLPAIAKLLVAKKQAGVDVRVILEDSYNHDVISRPRNHDGSEQDNPDGNYDQVRFRELIALTDANNDGRVTAAEMATNDAIYILKEAKVPLDDDTHDGSMGSGLMHHKFVVIDGKTTIMSSANFTASCIHGDKLVASSRGNANAMIVVESVAWARLFAEEFVEMWAGRFGSKKSFRGPRSVTIAGKKLTVQFSPTSRTIAWSSSTNGLIASTLKSAKTSIKAALFVFSEQRLADAMQQAQDHAEIMVVVDPKFAYRPYSEVLDLLGVALPDPVTCAIENGNAPWRKPADRAGVPSLARGDVLHHKFAVVDGQKVIFGSHNWSESANSINDEFALVIEDTTTANSFTREFNRVTSRARWGTPGGSRSLMNKLDSTVDACRRR